MEIDTFIYTKQTYVIHFGVVKLELSLQEYSMFNMWLHYFTMAPNPKGLIFVDGWGAKKLLIEVKEDQTCNMITADSLQMNQCIVLTKEQATRIAASMYDAVQDGSLNDSMGMNDFMAAPAPVVLNHEHRTMNGAEDILHEADPGVWIIGKQGTGRSTYGLTLIEDEFTGYCHFKDNDPFDPPAYPPRDGETLPYLGKIN